MTIENSVVWLIGGALVILITWGNIWAMQHVELFTMEYPGCIILEFVVGMAMLFTDNQILQFFGTVLFWSCITSGTVPWLMLFKYAADKSDSVK